MAAAVSTWRGRADAPVEGLGIPYNGVVERHLDGVGGWPCSRGGQDNKLCGVWKGGRAGTPSSAEGIAEGVAFAESKRGKQLREVKLSW